MSFESFYGGRRGASFIIARTFASKEEMITEFQKGSVYKEVKFDEYVLINSDNKAYPENGNVYKRGYDYTNDVGGAVYIGRFSGPTGVSVEDIENGMQETLKKTFMAKTKLDRAMKNKEKHKELFELFESRGVDLNKVLTAVKTKLKG